MNLGEKLLALRKEKNMSKEQLAELLGVSRQAVSKWETGESLPDVDKVVRLSQILGVTTDHLLLDQVEETPEEAPQKTEPSMPKMEAAPQPDKKPGLAAMVTGIVLGSVGLLTNLVIWILSTMIEVPDARNVSWTDDAGQIWYHTEAGYSFLRFVEEYRLWALVWIGATLLVVGAWMAWSAWERKSETSERDQ